MHYLKLLSLLSKQVADGVVNPTGFDRKEFVQKDGEWYEADVKAYSVAPLKKVETSGQLIAEDNAIENRLLRITFAPDGSINSMYDKKNKKELG